MKRRLFTALLTLALFCSPAKAEVLDKIIVVVNDEVITQRELDRVLIPIYQQYKSLYSEEELVERMDDVRTKVLEQMIGDKLILSRAKQEAIEVKDSEIEEEVDKVRKQFATDEEFKAVLRQQGLTMDDVKRNFKDKILVKKVVDRDVRSKVKVSPIELQKYYDEHSGEFKTGERVHARSILLKVTEDRDRDATLILAQQLLKRLEEGSDFSELAKRYSNGPYATQGGDMGYIKKGDMIERIDELLFSLEESEISGVLETDIGFHIFKIEKKEEPKSQSFNEAKEDIEVALYSEKFRKEFEDWMDELRKNAYIAIK